MRSEVRTVLLVLAAVPLTQPVLFLLSGVSFSTHQKFAFLTGAPSQYLILFVVIRSLSRSGRTFGDIGLTSRGWVREGLLGVLLGVGILVFAAVLFTVLEPIIPASTPPGLMPRWGALLYGFALLSAFAPIEEVVWRGYAITVLRKHVGVTAAVLMSSIAFGAMHWWGGLNLVVASTAAGLLYSGLFLWRRNLLGLIVAHFTSDFPLLVFMLLGIERPT